jgi:hypothetical protein
LLDLLRRVAALTILSAVGIGLLAPLTARSATPEDATADRLLAAVGASSVTLERGATGRAESAALTLSELFRPIGPESFGTSASVAAPASVPMEATLFRKAAPRPAPVAVAPPTAGVEVHGSASWYCCTLGYRGEAVIALPGPLGGHYDPPPAARYVTVCADRCVRLPVVDYCGCYWGTSSQRVADLSPEAWAAVSDAPSSRGLISVTIHLDG